MNKLFKANTLTICLLATTVQVIQGDMPNNPLSYWQVLITFFSGNQPKQQNNSNQAPAGVTAQDYTAQFRIDLNGAAPYNSTPVIPWHEVNEMIAIIEHELRFADLRNIDKVNQIILSVLPPFVKTKTKGDLDELPQKGIYPTAKDYATIPNSNEYNLLARLNRIPHLNGEAIAQYFGERRKNSTRQSVHDNSYNPH